MSMGLSEDMAGNNASQGKHSNASQNYTTLPPIYKEADQILGIIYVICLVFGFPANVISAVHFFQQHRELSNCLYIIITITDSSICLLCSLVGVNFFMERRALWFNNAAFCMGWRFCFKSLQRFSVALVLTLSVSRTINLVWPLRYIRKKVVLSLIFVYGLYLIVEFIVLGRHEIFKYETSDVYCFEAMQRDYRSVLNDMLHTATLALPMIPIVLSCVLSVYYVRRSTNVSKYNPSSSGVKKKATVTVIIFTGLYVAFNIPVVVNMVLWIITTQNYEFPGPFYQGSFMYNYMWNIADVLSVGTNSTCNPLVYLLRFKRCQRWSRYQVTRIYYGFLKRTGQGSKIHRRHHHHEEMVILRRYSRSRCPTPVSVSERSPVGRGNVEVPSTLTVERAPSRGRTDDRARLREPC